MVDIIFMASAGKGSASETISCDRPIFFMLRATEPTLPAYFGRCRTTAMLLKFIFVSMASSYPQQITSCQPAKKSVYSLTGENAVKAQTFFIPVDAHDHVSAILTLPDGGQEAKPRLGVITAHGAGNDMNNPLLVSFAEGLAAGGYPALRFNFPYKEKGLKAPDRMETLMGTWAAVLRFFPGRRRD